MVDTLNNKKDLKRVVLKIAQVEDPYEFAKLFSMLLSKRSTGIVASVYLPGIEADKDSWHMRNYGFSGTTSHITTYTLTLFGDDVAHDTRTRLKYIVTMLANLNIKNGVTL